MTPTYVDETHDSWNALYMSDLGRYLNARNHPMGNISVNNQDLLVKSDAGPIVALARIPSMLLMDFGQSNFGRMCRRYSSPTSVRQPWKADGIYFDHAGALGTLPTRTGEAAGGPRNELPSWGRFRSFSHGRGKSSGEPGYSMDTAGGKGKAAWLALDAVSSPPRRGFGGGLVRGWITVSGTSSSFRGCMETALDILVQIRHSSWPTWPVPKLSKMDRVLTILGNPVSYVDVLWFALGSFLLGVHDKRVFLDGESELL